MYSYTLAECQAKSLERCCSRISNCRVILVDYIGLNSKPYTYAVLVERLLCPLSAVCLLELDRLHHKRSMVHQLQAHVG